MKTIIICIVLVAMALSCDGNTQPINNVENVITEGTEKEKTIGALIAGKAAWEALGIDSYRYKGCYRGDDWPHYPIMTVTVLPGKEPEVNCDDIKALEKCEEYHYDINWDNPFGYGLTIEELYDSIIKEISQERWAIRGGELVKLELEYGFSCNETYHYPDFWLVSMGEGYVGGWYFFDITEFEVLSE
ncbi:MAG: hypothetical protein FWH41_08935 [Treponema sp.]|nr:hypothetical protein [Treponema sp.]